MYSPKLQLQIDTKYETVYRYSTLVPEKYRRRGNTKQLVAKAIESISKVHQIEVLFVWSFILEGDLAAETIARLAEQPLYKREK